jgi:hypothetical protein
MRKLLEPGYDVPIAPIGTDPDGDIAKAQRSRQLSTVLCLLDAGMPVSARLAADVYGVQFSNKTLRIWASWGGAAADKWYSVRSTYAHLAGRRARS